ncbi:MAG: NAD(P)/FAD-dependent oxidoreductase [Bdellovibrionales bacterium]|nr:NAD(P)/FAD-dependent oxidoreductase [Bdellovibrionales bacterium]
MKNVVIIGGGFAGINAAKSLAQSKDLKITLIDRRNYHLFQPLLYQVATAGLSPAEIASPIRAIMNPYPNVDVCLGNVKSIDKKNKTVQTENDEYQYDYLILACGAKHSYFGHPEWEDYAPGLKTLEQATEMRRRILLAYEMAEMEKDPTKQKEQLTFLIVGGGPTGVELAGAIAEISRFTLEKDFRHIDPSNTRIILIEAGKRVLSSFSPKLSKAATRDLERLGVQIWTGTRVTKISENEVQLGGETLKASTILWAAGVAPSSLGKDLNTTLDSVGRVVVQSDLSIENHPEIFVLGDQAAFMTKTGALPGLAPVAIQQGRWAAKNILLDLKSKSRKPFKYIDKGAMATVGRKKAVMQAFGLEMSGFVAWLAWLFVHIYYLVGFKNRFFVFYQWTWSYFTFSKGARLISNPNWKSQANDKNN